MQELIKYIADILNIKTESAYTIQDMTDELSKIKDIVAYRSYIKDNLDKIDYKTGFQKFIILTRDYLLLEYAASTPELSNFSKELTKKVKSSIWGVLYDKKELWWHGRDFGDYGFTEEEERILKKIGTTKEINRINDDGRLESEILMASKEDNVLPPYKDLTNRLSKMIGSTTKGMTWIGIET